MTKLIWDKVGERFYETGVNHGVLYQPDAKGNYLNGVVWNGLVTVSESPSGAEASAQYADNIKYLNLISAEEFAFTIEAFTYPEEFEKYDGTAAPIRGITVGQQNRGAFGFSYSSLIGNDLQGTDLGYKIHLVYGCQAAPSEKSRNTVNDSPEAVTFSWECTTTPVQVPGLKPSARITIDSTKVSAAALAVLEDIIYGAEGVDPRLPLPEEVFSIFEGSVVEVKPTKPTQAGADITIPVVTGIEYQINGEVVTGVVTITEPTIVTANALKGYKFAARVDPDWLFELP